MHTHQLWSFCSLVQTITAAFVSTPSRPAAATAATPSTLAMNSHHAGHAAAPAADIPHAVDAGIVRQGRDEWPREAEAHPNFVARRMTPAVARIGCLHVPLPLLTVTAMSGRIDTQAVYTNGASSHPYQLHFSTPSTCRMARRS